MVQNDPAKKEREYISPLLACLYWLPLKFRIEFKSLLLVFYYPNRAFRSQTAYLLVSKNFKGRIESRAFNHQVTLLWKQLQIWIQEIDTVQCLCVYTALLYLIISI